MSDRFHSRRTATRITTVSARIAEIVRLVTVVTVIDFVTAAAVRIAGVASVLNQAADENERSGDQTDGSLTNHPDSVDNMSAATVSVRRKPHTTTATAAIGVSGVGAAVDIIDPSSAATRGAATVRSNDASAITARITGIVTGTTKSSDDREQQRAENEFLVHGFFL